MECYEVYLGKKKSHDQSLYSRRSSIVPWSLRPRASECVQFISQVMEVRGVVGVLCLDTDEDFLCTELHGQCRASLSRKDSYTLSHTI